MSEPRRPPPPKSYVPLDLSTGPPQLPPRPPPADAGPPPNYTPPPPPLSDEEETDDGQGGGDVAPKPRPPPPAPYQPKSQPPIPQGLPASQGGLRPPPSRPTRPPTATTPSPDVQALSAPPRARPRANTVATSQPPSRPRGCRPEITMVSAQPMTGSMLSPQTRGAPSHSLPPSSLPPSSRPPPSRPLPSLTSQPAASQSPRVPSRKAPTRPPPSRNKPPPSPSPPQPARDSIQEEEAEETSDGPVAPPRRSKVNSGPLQKSRTLPPQPSCRQPPPPQRPSGEGHDSPAPPKPSPYTATPKPSPYSTRPPPPKPVRPPAQITSVNKTEAQTASSESPDGLTGGGGGGGGGGGIRIISARKPRQRPPLEKTLIEEGEEAGIDMESEPHPHQRAESEAVGDREEKEPLQTTKPETNETTETMERLNGDQKLQPQPTKRTKLPSQSPPPKPRRSRSRESSASSSDNLTLPQPRPRTNSASKPQFHKPRPPPIISPSPPAEKKGRHLSSSSSSSSSSPLARRSASFSVPSKPPPPLRPALSPSLSGRAAAAPDPRAKRRSLQVIQSEPSWKKEEGNSPVHSEPTVEPRKLSERTPPQKRPGKPPPPARQPSLAERDDRPRSAEGDVGHKREREAPLTPEAAAQSTPPQRRPTMSSDDRGDKRRPPGKPPPPRGVRQSEETLEGGSSRLVTKPRKPPPPRQPPTQPPVAGGGGGGGERGVEQLPVVERAPTVSEQQVSGSGGGEKETGVSEEKPQKKRRSLMVLRPGYEEQQQNEKRSPAPIKSKKATARVPAKPARPPSRPMTQPSKKKEEIETQLEPAQPEENTATTNTTENSAATALDSEPEGEQPEPPSEEAPAEEEKTGGEADAHETQEKTSEETAENATVAEETAQENTGVVLRRGGASAVVQLETRPKRPRPMSMPPGRPGSRPKPPAPSARPQQGQTKPAQPPARPAHGPARPAKGPSRPPQAPITPTATTQLSPNVPPSLPPRPTPGHSLYKYVCTEPHGIALTNHDTTDPVELPYETGDVIELIEKVDGNWFYARNADLEMCEGMVPARDLHVVKRLPGESTVSGFEEGPCAVATFTFKGQTMDELSFKEGELIMLKTRVGGEWLRGKLVSGQEGIFPRSFVEIVEDLPEDAVEEMPAPTQSESTVEVHGPHCVAVYDFKAAGSDELSLSVGDVVELVGRVGAEWLRGRLRGHEGIFPAQFVEVKEDLPPATTDEGLSKTLYDFKGQEGELSFKAGVSVKVVCRVNEEWVEGELGGKRGMFPVSFVDHLPPDLPSKAATTEPTQPSPQTGECEAVYDFTAENAGELSFKTGDLIVTLEWVNEEWMNGRIGDQEGMFPIEFVKILKELPKPKSTRETSEALSHLTKLDDSLLPRAQALTDFTASDDSHLSFKTGDILNLLERVGNGDWYSGENTRTGGFGDFPASTVRVIEPLP